MSSGELWVFGAPLPRASSLGYIDSQIREANHAMLQQREAKKCILPPADATNNGGEPACIAITRLITDTLLLLEDGQVASLDEFQEWSEGEGEGWIAGSFRQLNQMRLPLVDLVVGGCAAPSTKSPGVAGVLSAGSGHHFLALTHAGDVYVWGHNERGQLGLGHTRMVREPTRLEKFTTVSAGYNASAASGAAATEEAKDASAASSEAASSPGGANIKLASRAPVPARIVAIAAGKAHSVLLTSEGSVYTFGRDMEGQCGLTIASALGAPTTGRAHSTLQLSMHVSPRFVHHLSGARIVAIAAANHATLALDDQGTVWQWGYGLAKEQINVPTRVEFEQDSTEETGAAPRIIQIALGSAHALLLSESGQVYSFGVGLTGALGHDFPEGAPMRPRLTSARRIDAPVDLSFVSVVCGAFSSAMLDSQGRVYTCGSGAEGKLGLASSEDTPTPQLVRGLVGKTVSALYLGARRMLAMVPTKLTDIAPRTVQIQGGTALSIRGAGFFTRELGHSEAANHSAETSQIVVSFSYQGLSARVPASYDAVTDTLRLVSPSLVRAASKSSAPTKGGAFQNGHLQNAIVRVSMDRGAHFSNALALHVFAQPNMNGSSSSGSKNRAAAAVAAAEIVPASGPIQGGSALELRARFDVVPYDHILVRFRVATSGSEIATVSGEFDPVKRCVRCVAPTLPAELIPPSAAVPPPQPPTSPSGRPSRFHRPAPVPRPASRVEAAVELSLDGQNLFAFGPSGGAAPFAYHAVTASSVSPAVIGVAGADIELSVRGVHCMDPSKLALRFTVHDSFRTMQVPARFVPLAEHRAAAKIVRDREARAARKARADALEAARVRALALAAEEEENRDPKERERLLREKEKADKEREKERAKAEKAAAAAAEKAEKLEQKAAAQAAASRPGSSGGDGLESPSRPRSSAGGKRPSSRGGATTPHREASPHSIRPATADKSAAAAAAAAAATAAAAAAALVAAAPASSVVSSAPVPEEQDEWSVAEDRIAAAESAEDARLALLSPEDRAAVGFLCARAPLFTEFGACEPAITVTLNGRDFVPLPSVLLRVSRPVPSSLRPGCGPSSGGTVVEVQGDHFYFAPHIDVQLRASVAPISAAAAATAAAAQAAAAAASAKSRPISAAKPKSASDKHKPAVAAAAVPEPVPALALSSNPSAQAPAPSHPAHVQTVPSEFVVQQAPAQPCLRFVTPSWHGHGGSGSLSVATVHVGFEPDSNAFSAGAALPSFVFYDPPVVLEAHPLLVSQAGGTEVVLSGRGFVASETIRVRLVLPEVEEDPKAKAKAAATATAAATAAAAPSADGDSTPHSTSRKLKGGAASAAAPAATAAPVALAPTPPPKPLSHVDVPACFVAHDSPEELEEFLKVQAKRKPKSSSSAAAAAAAANSGAAGAHGPGKAGAAGDSGEMEPATIVFSTPAATVFSALFADGSAMNRALEVELALNGQQFERTGIVLRFEKDNKAAKKPKPAAAVAAELAKKK